jgi:hypothetical protein
MHICLLPPEILLRVFAIYQEDFHGSRATLAFLARTCQTFKEPALDILWQDLDGLEPILSCLVACLPAGVSDKNTRGKLVSEIFRIYILILNTQNYQIDAQKTSIKWRMEAFQSICTTYPFFDGLPSSDKHHKRSGRASSCFCAITAVAEPS